MLSHISKGWQISIAALLTTTPTGVVLWFQDLLLPYAKDISPAVIVRGIAIMLLLLLTSLILAGYTYFISQKSKYQFYPELGLKGNIEKGLFFCPKCEKPMRVEHDHFFCILCENKVSLPNKQTAEMVWNITEQKRLHL